MTHEMPQQRETSEMPDVSRKIQTLPATQTTQGEPSVN